VTAVVSDDTLSWTDGLMAHYSIVLGLEEASELPSRFLGGL